MKTIWNINTARLRKIKNKNMPAIPTKIYKKMSETPIFFFVVDVLISFVLVVGVVVVVSRFEALLEPEELLPEFSPVRSSKSYGHSPFSCWCAG